MIVLAVLQGCASGQPRTTVRIIDGAPQQTRYVGAGAYAHYLKAQVALGRGELQGALEQLRAALIMDPESPHLHTSAAMVLVQLGQLELAHQMIRRALAFQAGYPDALVLQGQIFHRQNKLAAAERSFRLCIRHNPGHAAGHLELSALLEQAGRPGPATRVLKSMVQQVKGPGRDQAYRRLATLCLRQVNYPCARQQLRLSLGEQTALVTLVKLAHVLRAMGDAPGAVKLLREAFDRTNGDMGVATALLDLLHHKGTSQEVDDLLTVLATAAQDRPEQLHRVAELALHVHRPRWALQLVEQQLKHKETPELQIARAMALEKLGRSSEAEKLLAGLVGGDSGMQASLQLAELMQRHQRHREASETLRQALTRHGHNTVLVLALSRSLHLEGKNDASTQVVRAALLGHPDDRELLFGLAAAFERIGSWREALKQVRRILARHPNDAPALNFLGYTLADNSVELDRAERSIRRALFLEPGRGYIIDSLGWLHFRRGNRARAKTLLHMAARLSPAEPEILAHLAEVHVALKSMSQAIQLLRRAISVSEDDLLTTKLRRRLDQLERGRVGTR